MLSRIAILNPRVAETTLGALVLSAALLDALRMRNGNRQIDGLVAQLNGIDPGGIEGDDSRTAFWLNLYNSLLLHRLALEPARGSMLRHPGLFSSTAYVVGGNPYSLDQIEHGVLRCNRRPPLRFRRPLRPGDQRLRSLPSRLDPRIHFALNCGARSCPPIQVYDGSTLDEELELATRSYLTAETTIDPRARKVTLPRLMRLYSGDFGSRVDQLAFATTYVPELAAMAPSARAEVRVGYGRFDWTAIAATDAA